jgi:hypothetical protein
MSKISFPSLQSAQTFTIMSIMDVSTILNHGLIGLGIMLDLKALSSSVMKQEGATRMIQRILMVPLDQYAVPMMR